MPRPFVVVLSGNTQRIEPGCFFLSSCNVNNLSGFGAASLGAANASKMARNSDICSTFLTPGYDRVKTGQKMPARYSGSSGLVKLLAITVPAYGR